MPVLDGGLCGHSKIRLPSQTDPAAVAYQQQPAVEAAVWALYHAAGAGALGYAGPASLTMRSSFEELSSL